MEDGETKKVLRREQMYIDEDPGNRFLNKSKTILIRILNVTLVFLYFYFHILNIFKTPYALLSRISR